ncbi:MAG: acyl-CoA dehydrogenase family protein [Rickettsiales bacterium]|nr:acyl-CoA dehydrogenase family protein [Rickettsiales bacterium]
MKLTETQTLIRDMAKSFATETLAPGASARDAESRFPHEEIKMMGELGLMGMLIPESYGGAGVDYVSMALAVEEIAAADASCSTIMSVQNSLVGAGLLQFGNDWQKEQFLKPIAQGHMLSAFALTEPQAGSDAASLRTTATKNGDHYVLNGTKQFITSGKNAQLAIVFAVTDKNAGKKGISAFLVPTSTPGYSVPKLEHKLGQLSSDTAQLQFDDMRLPATHMLGKEGEGYKLALSNLEGGRIGIAAQAIGMARAALDFAIAYAKERETFGKPIIKHQAVAFRLADMATELEAARQLLHHAAQLRDANIPCVKEACMAKLFASEMAERVTSGAIQTLGGYGYVKDFPLERIYRDMRVCQLYEGTSDIQRIVISREWEQ